MENTVDLTNKDLKIKLFSHNDLDGYGCDIVMNMAFNNVDTTYVSNPDHASRALTEFMNREPYGAYDMIFITDISVNEEVAKNIDEYLWQKIVLLDHHKTAEYLNEYEWANVEVEHEFGHKNSGTNMLFEYLIRHNALTIVDKYFYALANFVEKVRRYDTWEWKSLNDHTALNLNRLFFLMGGERFKRKYLDRFKANIFTFYRSEWNEIFDNSDVDILSIDERSKEDYVFSKSKSIKEIDFLGHKIGVVFAENYISELGNDLSEDNQHLDLIAMIDMSKGRISYRSTHEDIDVTDIAKHFGGGGHKSAGGSSFNQEIIDSTIGLIFGTQELRRKPWWRRLYSKFFKSI